VGSTVRDDNVSATDRPIRIGVSACLIGQAVRFDGGHKRNEFIIETLGRFVELVPVCPEFELGLGVPRETLRLVRDHDANVSLVANESGIDHTAAMRRFANRRTTGLAREGLSGYLLKKDSPSCGMERVKVYGTRTAPSRDGRGLYAASLMSRYPSLPVEEEGRLNDPRLRENFIERVFAYRRLRTFFDSRWTIDGLIAFHTVHKLQLLAHAPREYAHLGRFVASANEVGKAKLRDHYEAEFMAILKHLATPARHENVLRQAIGYFKDKLDTAALRELTSLIEDYRRNLVPLIVPITLIRHYVRAYAVTDLEGQIYLEPHPKELLLCNHV
jgi:uncharacterized protein YbgA (DUF1722 family)/uncharacterized protein YbbK (DUF523 family)